MSEIVNRVAQSTVQTINLEKWFPKNKIIEFDIGDYLFQGLILKEKDFREELKSKDWSSYDNCFVHVHCSADAIVPTWAFMLVSSYLATVTEQIYYGNQEEALSMYYEEYINNLDIDEYRDGKIILKGCSNHPVPNGAYLALTARLRNVVQSLMFGEACSAVPIFKNKKQ